MLIKNQIYETQIVDYTSEGQGVAKIDGCAVFIPNAIVGEKCTVRIEKAQKTWAAGKIVELLEKAIAEAISSTVMMNHPEKYHGCGILRVIRLTGSHHSPLRLVHETMISCLPGLFSC